MMFVPGNTPKMINSADIHGADSIMIDIEDSVAVTEKDTARLFNCRSFEIPVSSAVKSVVRSTILHKLLMVMMILM